VEKAHFWDIVTAASSALSALVALGAVVAAWLATRYARGQLDEARRLRIEQAQPYVIVDFEPSEAWATLLDIKIQNTGATPAKDVKIEFEPSLASTLYEDRDQRIGEAAIFRQGIPFMAPGRKICMLFEHLNKRHERTDLPREYVARVSYEGGHGVRETQEYILDLNQYYGWQYARVYGVHDGMKALREIERKLDKWTAHFNGLRVYTIDERRLQEDLRREFEARQQEEGNQGNAGSGSA
jgi:hypothetical protein